MGKIKIYLLVISLTILITGLIFAEDVVKLEKVNQAPFLEAYRARAIDRVETPEFARQVVMDNIQPRNNDVIKETFKKAGYNFSVFLDFQKQIKNTPITATEIKPGDQMEWMLFRIDIGWQAARPMTLMKKNVVWCGKEPLRAYAFKIISQNRVFKFVIIEECGNLVLLKS